MSYGSLKGTSVELVPTTVADLDFVLWAEGLPSSRPWVFSWPRERHFAAIQKPDIAHYVIRADGREEPCGYCFLEGLEHPWGIIELTRIVVTEPGRGFGRDAIVTLARHAFNDLKAMRFWLDVVSTNAHAIALYTDIGFRHEGTLRNAAIMEGRVSDMSVYSLLPGELVEDRGGSS